MSPSSRSRLSRTALAGLAGLAGAALVPASVAGAAGPPKRCDAARGDRAHNPVVKVFKLKVHDGYRFYGCARERGPVVALTQPFRGNQVRMVASSGAFAAFTRTIAGKDTIAAVDARTGKKRRGFFPPDKIEFDIDSRTPQIGAARVNARGELVVAYLGLGDGTSTDSAVFIFAFDNTYVSRELDHGPSSRLDPKSIRLSGEHISWTNHGVTRTATMGK
jgi:hypothetical protein